MRYVAVFLSALASFAFGQLALAQGKQDFTLINSTGYAIRHVYVSPANAEAWDDDILGKDILEDDEEVPITFSRKERSCKWDLLVTYDDDGSKVIWRGFDLCQITKITIKYNRKTDTTSATTE